MSCTDYIITTYYMISFIINPIKYVCLPPWQFKSNSILIISFVHSEDQRIEYMYTLFLFVLNTHYPYFFFQMQIIFAIYCYQMHIDTTITVSNRQLYIAQTLFLNNSWKRGTLNRWCKLQRCSFYVLFGWVCSMTI